MQASAAGPQSISSIRRKNRQDAGDGANRNPHPTSPQALCTRSDDLTLMLQWKIAQSPHMPDHGPRFGQSHKLSMPARHRVARWQTYPLTVTLTYPTVLHHQFTADTTVESEGMVLVPVRLHLHNSTKEGGKPCSFKFTCISGPSTFSTPPLPVRGAKGNSRTSIAPTNTRPQLLWAGNRVRNVEKLPPGESVDLNLTACIGKEGVYDLNCFEITITDHSTGTARKTRDRFLLYVYDTGNATPPSFPTDVTPVQEAEMSHLDDVHVPQPGGRERKTSDYEPPPPEEDPVEEVDLSDCDGAKDGSQMDMVDEGGGGAFHEDDEDAAVVAEEMTTVTVPEDAGVPTEDVDVTTEELDVDVTTEEVDVTAEEVDVTAEEVDVTTDEVDMKEEDPSQDLHQEPSQEGEGVCMGDISLKGFHFDYFSLHVSYVTSFF
jgi:hypothetical protein